MRIYHIFKSLGKPAGGRFSALFEAVHKVPNLMDRHFYIREALW